MKAAVCIVFLFVLQALGYDNPKIGDLPKGADKEILSILGHAEGLIRGTCNEPNPNHIEFLLYTHDSKHTPVKLNPQKPQEIDASKRLMLVIHGWVAGAHAYGIQELKDALLNGTDTNVVIVNWKPYAWQLYSQSVCLLPKIGKLVAEFLCTVSHQKRIPLEEIILVGHSLGGQMSGFIGQQSKEVCEQNIGEIIAMDPAGPLFFGADSSNRLDQSDANFVQIIHTNGGEFGYLQACGHIDFYVNCGSIQANCLSFEISRTAIVNMPISVVACSHLRALDYMSKSVEHIYKGKSCPKCPLGCPPLKLLTSQVRMGLETPKTARGSYYVDVVLKGFDLFTDQTL